jgi:hypothetical protein
VLIKRHNETTNDWNIMKIRPGDRIQTIDSYETGTIIHVGATTISVDWDIASLETHDISSISFRLIGA